MDRKLFFEYQQALQMFYLLAQKMEFCDHILKKEMCFLHHIAIYLYIYLRLEHLIVKFLENP